MSKQNGNLSYISGVFVRELKNRFLCEVRIDGKVEECYVPSSCHLGNFLELNGKRVLLIPTQTKNSRTKYALYAMPYKRNFIILNTSLSNKVIDNSIHSRRFSFLGKRKDVVREHYIDNYKADLYIPKTKTIIEIKSILSDSDSAIFPTVFSERTQNQLKKLQTILDKGYKAVFIIVSLNPYLKSVQIDAGTEFYKELIECMKKGLEVHAYSCCLTNYALSIKKKLPIRMGD